MSSISEQLGVGGRREPESKMQLSRGGFQSICSSAFLIVIYGLSRLTGSIRASLVVQMVKNPPAMQETRVGSLV